MSVLDIILSIISILTGITTFIKTIRSSKESNGPTQKSEINFSPTAIINSGSNSFNEIIQINNPVATNFLRETYAKIQHEKLKRDIRNWVLGLMLFVFVILIGFYSYSSHFKTIEGFAILNILYNVAHVISSSLSTLSLILCYFIATLSFVNLLNLFWLGEIKYRIDNFPLNNLMRKMQLIIFPICSLTGSLITIFILKSVDVNYYLYPYNTANSNAINPFTQVGLLYLCFIPAVIIYALTQIIYAKNIFSGKSATLLLLTSIIFIGISTFYCNL